MNTIILHVFSEDMEQRSTYFVVNSIKLSMLSNVINSIKYEQFGQIILELKEEELNY